MPRLRILAGPSTTDLKEIRANTSEPTDVSSDAFAGKIAVFIQGFADPSGDVPESAYFEQEERKDVTWSIQMQGRFLQPHSANDILFGNVFEKPLPIPWGFSAILNFMQYVDPTLEQDLQSKTKPWALSPLISTMPHLTHTKINLTDPSSNAQSFPPNKPLKDSTSDLPFNDGNKPSDLVENSADSRRSFFRSEDNRKLVSFGPEDLITMDFCYNYLTFSPTGVSLKIPGGLHMDLMRFWDGQSIHFVCCERGQPDKSTGGQPLGRVFWCVSIDVLQDEEDIDAEGEIDEEIDDDEDDNDEGQVRSDDVD